MTNKQKLKYLKKAQGIKMQITPNTISISLSKTQTNAILAEAMQDEVASLAIKKVLNPFITNSFPAFPEYTNITLGATDENGVTTVALKIPTVKKTVIEEFEPAEENV